MRGLFKTLVAIAALLVLASATTVAAQTAARWGATDADFATLDGSVLRHQVRALERRREFERAAERGDPYAQAVVASAYVSEIYTPANDALARQLAQRSADSGNVRGMLIYAQFLRYGRGGPVDERLAVQYLTAAVNAGSPQAMAFLSEFRTAGIGGLVPSVDEEAALDRLAAENGAGEGMRRLAWRLQNGVGEVKDLEQAAYWYDRATLAGNILAYYDHATTVSNGIGIEANQDFAAQLMRDGAELGDPRAMYGLGFYLENGLGMPESLAGAAHWYARAADRGLLDGKIALGRALLSGRGVAPDVNRGLALLQEGADAGSAGAMTSLGYAYYTGQNGVPVDRQSGLSWYLRAAERDSPVAIYNVGTVYDDTPGLRDQATAWYQRAVDLGYEPAVEAIRQRREYAAAEERRLAQAEAARVRAALQQEQQQQRAQAASALRDPRASSQGAPTQAEVLALTSRMVADAYGWRTTSVPGQVVVSSLLGDMMQYQRSISGLRCVNAGTNKYSCSYDVVSTAEPVQTGSLMSMVGALSTSMASAMGTAQTRSHNTHEFVRSGGRWTSTTLQQAIAADIAASAGRSGSVGCPSCTTLEQQRAIDRGNNQMMNDLYRAPSWHR